MKHNFTIRIHQDTARTVLSNIQSITIAGITILSKQSKFDGICWHLGNQKKFGYSFKLSRRFHWASGSNNYPTLTFDGKGYLDIIVKDFPRFPAFYQDEITARNYMNGWGYTNHINQGFPIYLMYRNVEIIIN